MGPLPGGPSGREVGSAVEESVYKSATHLFKGGGVTPLRAGWFLEEIETPPFRPTIPLLLEGARPSAAPPPAWPPRARGPPRRGSSKRLAAHQEHAAGGALSRGAGPKSRLHIYAERALEWDRWGLPILVCRNTD